MLCRACPFAFRLGNGLSVIVYKARDDCVNVRGLTVTLHRILLMSA